MSQETLPKAQLLDVEAFRAQRRADRTKGARIVLVRHGRPAIAIAPSTSHHGFRSYIDAYEAAGLDPSSTPPKELRDLVTEIDSVLTSGRPRAHDSARVLAPHAELIADQVFVEAPLASPRIPLLRLRVTQWAVIARILWHAGFHPRIENYGRAKKRAATAAEFLLTRARRDGIAVLVAHGYFNLMIGRELRRRGFTQTGTHRARYWNSVIYERWNEPDDSKRSE